MPGYDTNRVPGAPALPVYNTLVELPADGDWRLAVQLIGTQVLATRVDIPAAPGAAPAPIGPAGWSGADLPDVVPTVVQPDPTIYRVDAFYPASPVQTGEVQIQRGRRYLPVHVFPFQYNPQTRQLRYQPDVRVTVTPLPAPPHPLTPFAPAHFSAPQITRSVQIWGEGVVQPAVRIYTTARGLYHLTYTDLISAGVTISEMVPSTLAMTYLGQPIDIQVTDGNGNGQFDPGDEVIFYAEPYQGRYMTRNVYWLTYGAAAGARMNSRGVTPTGSEPLVTTITQTLHIEYDRDYRSLYHRPDNADHWFDTQLDVSTLTGVFTKSVTYTLNLDDPITATGSIGLRAVLHGGQDNATLNPDQSVSVRVNNHVVGVYQWEGSTDYTVTANAPATWLDAVTNTLTLQTAVSQLPGITTYWVSPDWVEVAYPALAKTQNDRQYIEGVESGSNEVAVSGFTTSTVSVYDVRDARHPAVITSTLAQSVSGTTTLHFWDADLPTPGLLLEHPGSIDVTGRDRVGYAVDVALIRQRLRLHRDCAARALGADRSAAGPSGGRGAARGESGCAGHLRRIQLRPDRSGGDSQFPGVCLSQLEQRRRAAPICDAGRRRALRLHRRERRAIAQSSSRPTWSTSIRGWARPPPTIATSVWTGRTIMCRTWRLAACRPTPSPTW